MAVDDMEITMNLLHQPSNSCDSEDEGETLSLRDLPLTTTSTSTSRSIAWDEEAAHHHHHDHDHDQDVFEFFGGDFSHEEKEDEDEDKDSIMFCGKIIPRRKPHQENYNSTDEISTMVKEEINTRSNFQRRRSSSHNEPRPADCCPSGYQIKRFWSLPLSPPSAAANSSGRAAALRVPPSMKSRWYVLAFGAGKAAGKMELNDMKLRQSKKMSSSNTTNINGQSVQRNEEGRNQQVAKKVNRSRNKKGSWPGLLGVLGCSGEEGSAMVKASSVCRPLPAV